MKTAITIITALSLSVVSQTPEDNPGRQEQIEQFRERLDIKRSQYEELESRERDQIEKLRSIEEQIALSNQLLLKIRRESDRLKRSIAGHDRQLENSHKDYDEKKKALYARLKYIYKHGGRPAWLSLLSSGNPTEALVAFKNIESIMRYDRQLVSSIESLSKNIERELRDMKSEKQQLEDFESEYAEELELRKSSLDVRKELLGQIRNDKSEVAGAISSLEQDMEAVADIFADLDEEKVNQEDSLALPGLEKQRGNLIWPLQGKILRSFGSRKDERGIKLTNPGIDIKGSIGMKVLASATGKTIYISWLRGYGQFIILDHGEGYYTLYANLSDIYVEIGDMVQAGEVIAEVGELGSLEGPGLHFELRQEKKSLDPVRWLR
jgi:septal ring factor EnvC (AmiA/AmiB activator)